MAAAIINSILTPWTISFKYVIDLAQDEETYVYWLGRIANIIFIVDIIVNFLASYRDTRLGAEIFHPKSIAIHYFKTEFAFDFISTLELRRIAKNLFGITSGYFVDLADMCQLLKAFRIKRILHKIQSSNYNIHAKAQWTILFWVMVIVLYTHIFACLIWWFMKEDELWVTPLDMGFFSLRVYFPE